MKVLWLVLALLLLSWHALASSCEIPSQRGEWMQLELVSVTVDGIPLENLDRYSHYDVRLEGGVDPYDYDAVIESCDFDATPTTVDGTRLTEHYPVEADLDEIW